MANRPTRKTASVTITAAHRAHALRNAAQYGWAAQEQDAAVQAARPYLAMDDEALWKLVPSQELPRSIHIYRVLGSNKTCHCPWCGPEIVPFGNYPWVVDVLNRPWKIECPNCHHIFPSNDFGAFYATALDQHGFFRQEMGDRSLLVNPQHPDPADPMHRFQVDDGYGWRDPDGQRWDFIAVYVAWGLWVKIREAVDCLARAYTLTSDPEYARKCGLLLARLADVYPEMDWWAMSQRGFSHSDGGSGIGRVSGRIWECADASLWALSYDRIFDAIAHDLTLCEFVKRRHAAEDLAAVRSPGGLCAHIEASLLEEIAAGVKDGRLFSNQGGWQATMILTAIALDRPGESADLIDWAFRSGTRIEDPGHPGRMIVTGGDLDDVLIRQMDREGLGCEGAPGYSTSWGSSLIEVANLLERSPHARGRSLYHGYPKFRRYFTDSWKWSCLDAATPPIGDSGQTGAWQTVDPPANALLRAFQIYGEPDLARHALKLLDGNLSRAHGSIFEEEPEALREAVALAGAKPQPLESRLLDGFGLATLQAPHREHGRALWLYFGRNTGHGHLDRLNLGLYAENIDMLPDLGYPEYASMRPRDLAWTRNNASHNVPIVDGAAQQPSFTGHVRLFEPEGLARLVEVESDGIYAGAPLTRRTTWLIDVNERYSYVVDIVRVRGGSEHMLGWHGPAATVTTHGLSLTRQDAGTYAGVDVPLEALAHDHAARAGTSFLYGVERQAGTLDSFFVDYLAEDLRGRIAAGREPHLRIHNLTPVDEAAMADGDPPQNKQGNPKRLKYLLLKRAGADLDSIFVTVLEPYDRTPFLRSVTLLPVEAGPGSGTVAVRIETDDGRTDTILSLQEPGEASCPGLGLVGQHAFTARRAGSIELARLARGTRLECEGLRLTAAAPEYRGQITGVDFSDPTDQRLQLDCDIPEVGRVPGRLLVVQNDGEQDAAYQPVSWPAPSVVSAGSVPLVRERWDRFDPGQGFVTNVEAGHRFAIPTFAYVELQGDQDGESIANVDIAIRRQPS